MAYGNCCPGPVRRRPHRFQEDFVPGSPFPPGAVIRAHVQSVDLMPFEPEHRAMDPGEALDRFIRQEQVHAHRQRSVDPRDAPHVPPTSTEAATTQESTTTQEATTVSP